MTYKKPYFRRMLLLAFGQRFALSLWYHDILRQPLLKNGAEAPAELILPKTTLILPEEPYIAMVIGGTHAGKR